MKNYMKCTTGATRQCSLLAAEVGGDSEMKMPLLQAVVNRIQARDARTIMTKTAPTIY